MTSIRKKAAIQFLASNGAMVVNFLLAIVMARLLSPAEIGVFSITAVIVSVSHVFRDFGVASYLKQEKTLTPELLSAATGVLIASSWTIATLLYFSSGYVAEYFAQPGIYDVMRVLAVGFYFIPFGSIPQALLQRRLATEKTAIVTAVSTAVYSVTCITLASLGFSYMTMAWANLMNIIVTGLALMVLRPRDIPWYPSLRGWGRVTRFGIGSMLTSTLSEVDKAIPDIMLGKLSSAHNVGLFSRANSTVNIFNHISGPTIAYMALPYLAKSHHDGRDLAAEVSRAIGYLTGLIWPALIVTAVMATDIIQFLYGKAWLDCAEVIPYLCVAVGIQAIFAFMIPALTGIGKPYWSALPLMFSVTAKVTIAFIVFDGTLVSFGWAVMIAEIFAVPGQLYLAHRFLKISMRTFAMSIVGSLAISLVMLCGVELLKFALTGLEFSFLRLSIVGLALLPIWLGTVSLFKHPLQHELKALRSIVNKRRASPPDPVGSDGPLQVGGDDRVEKASQSLTAVSGTPLWARSISIIARGGLTGKAEQRLSILTFHKLPSAIDLSARGELSLQDFFRLLDILQENFNLMPLEEGIARMNSSSLPPFSVALTFDDGYPNWFQGVVPLLAARGIHATFFISTGQLEGRALWFERLDRVLTASRTRRRQLSALFGTHGVRVDEQDANFERCVIKAIKFQPVLRRDAIISECEAVFEVDADYPIFSVGDVLALQAQGFAVGAHTVNHPILACCTDEEARLEICQSKQMLEDILREPIDLFAYPNGVPNVDIRPSHVRMVRDARFRAAVTTALGAASNRTSKFQLPRMDPWTRTHHRFLAQYLLSLRSSVPVIHEDANTPAIM